LSAAYYLFEEIAQPKVKDDQIVAPRAAKTFLFKLFYFSGNLDSGWITVMFTKLSTECSFDYVFVFDGPSPESPLLASFSGQSQPQNVTGHSGQVSWDVVRDSD
jgi:CUB domain